MSNYKYVLNAITGKLDKVADSALFKLKGIVDTTADLPLTGNAENDCYIVKANDRLYTWNSSSSTGLITNWVDVGSVSSVDWSVITNKPSSSVANIDLAVAHKDVTTGNPHSVSKSDVGLGNVDNKSEATIITDVKADSDVASAISLKHTQGTDQALDTGGANEISAVNAKAAYTHSGVTSGNPHSVSKSDVGLGNVDNKSESTIITDVKADSDVADALSKKHAQGSDTTLGSMSANIDMNSHKLTGLSVPSSNGDSIRATTKITEANLEAAIDYKLSSGEHTELTAWLDDVVLVDGGEIQLGTTTKIQFRDADIYISSKDDGHLDLDADTQIDLNTATIHFGFASAAYLYIRDTNIAIGSATDGHLDLYADTSIDLNSDVDISGTLKYDGSDTNPTNLLSNGDFESWSAGTAVAPDGWTFAGAGASIARESTIIKRGAYSTKVTRSGADCFLYQNIINAANPIDYWKSREVTMSAWVYATVADRARVYIYSDGQYFSSYHSGNSTWEFLSVTITVDNASTEISGAFAISTGDTTAYFDGAMLVEGSTPFAFSSNQLDFLYQDNLIVGTNQLQFRDSAIHIASLDDGHLDLTADVSIDLNSDTILGIGKYLYDADKDTGICVEETSDSDEIVAKTAGTEALRIHDDGNITKPVQSSFLVRADGTQTNLVAGDDRTVNFSGTQHYNIGSDWDGTNTYTAPVTGKYLFCACVMLDDIDADASDVQLKLHSSNFDAVVLDFIVPSKILSSDGTMTLNGSMQVDMDVGDTVIIEVRCTGGANQTDISDNSWLSGCLLH